MRAYEQAVDDFELRLEAEDAADVAVSGKAYYAVKPVVDVPLSVWDIADPSSAEATGLDDALSDGNVRVLLEATIYFYDEDGAAAFKVGSASER